MGNKEATKQLTTVAGFHMPQATHTMDYIGNTDPDRFLNFTPFFLDQTVVFLHNFEAEVINKNTLLKVLFAVIQLSGKLYSNT